MITAPYDKCATGSFKLRRCAGRARTRAVNRSVSSCSKEHIMNVPMRNRFGGIAAVLGLLVLASCADMGDELPTSPPAASESVAPVDRGPQDFGPAIRAAERHTPALMQRPGVVGTGVGLDEEGRPSVRIFLVHGQVRDLPARLDNVPVSRVVTGNFVLRQDRTARARPAPIGFSVGHPNITAGTLGARVTNGSQVFILSNNHILANNNNASIGDAALQPGAFDGGSEPNDVIGTLHDFEPFNFDSNNLMDAAIALVNPNDISGSTPSTAGYGAPSTNTVTATVGMGVQKYGRTTGHTFGTVAETNVTVSVCFETRGPFTCARSATFVGQFTVTDGSFSAGGDSGSLIVTASGNNPVGLLFAGSSTRTIANPIQVVLDRFGVTIDPTIPDGNGGPPDPDPDPTGPTASFTDSCSELACTFDGSGSTAGDAAISTYGWTFGDGNSGSGATVSHTYAAGGTYTVTLTVTDADGLSDSASRTVSVAEAPGEGELGIQQFNVSARTQGPWRRADVTWSVSHSGGDLASVRTELRSGTTVLDAQTSSVSGGSASGEHSVRTRSGAPDRVRLIVTDGQGNQLIEEKPVSF
ncbi:MAG: PKD domain-containing protein [Gemmatimonadales bacterium]|nr:MAG: PKD domain-containing protein [Gemmatimonadales bacterium]